MIPVTESIMAIIACPRCNKQISNTTRSCPLCGQELKSLRGKICPKCNVDPITIERKKGITLNGIIGAMVVIAALPVLFFDFLVGTLLLVLGVLIGWSGRGKYTEIVCPECKKVLGKVEWKPLK